MEGGDGAVGFKAAVPLARLFWGITAEIVPIQL